MGDTLNITSERAAYTITDHGTYLGLKDWLVLPILVEGETVLVNVYHVITLNPENRSNINTASRCGGRLASPGATAGAMRVHYLID
jgi:tungstate transport system substrate-binding protein